jgi:hypothetical protein
VVPLKEPSLQRLKAAAARQVASAADVAVGQVLAEVGRVPAVAVRVVALASAKVLRIPSVAVRASAEMLRVPPVPRGLEVAVPAARPAPEAVVRTPCRSAARPSGLAATAV